MSVATAGTSVRLSSREPSSAKQTVMAIGVNSRRSTRSSVSRGMYAAMMMSSEKRIGRWTSRAAVRTGPTRPAPEAVSSEHRAISCRMRSTITMVASTMMPKSMAPMLSRLSETPDRRMQTKANSSESGMTSAVSSAARRLSRNTSSTVTTTTNPSSSTRVTVWSVLATRVVRS